MCVTTGPAKLANTIIYMGEAQHPEHGLVHVTGYQNKPTSTSGPNAMLLHLPAANPLGSHSVIEMPDDSDFLTRLQQYMAVHTFRMERLVVFDTGIYTVVLTEAGLIHQALALVDERKRPVLNPELLAWYEKNLPRYQLAVCCFNNTDYEKKPAPLFWWYKPIREDVLMAPGIDAHDGNPPDLGATVDVTTALVIGSFRIHDEVGRPMMERMPPAFVPFAPTRLRATEFFGKFSNGDFLIDVSALGQLVQTSDIMRRGVMAL